MNPKDQPRGRGRASGQKLHSSSGPRPSGDHEKQPAWGKPSTSTGVRGPRPMGPHPAQAEGRATLHRISSNVAGDRKGAGDSGAAKGGDGGMERNVAGRGDTVAVSAGGFGKEATRGMVRGKRILYDLVHTRPENIKCKRGTSGKEVVLTSNYFRIIKKPTWCLYQYHVDFTPQIEINRDRKRLLIEHKPKLGGYIFDGTILYIAQKLFNDPTEFVSKYNENETVLIKIQFTRTVSMTDYSSIQILNIILRKSMEGLDLQLIGRNFFDPVAKVDIRDYQLQLWPGYTTSIRQHEQDILMCADLSHKVMRLETMYDILQKCTQENRNYQDTFQKEVTGMIVLTDYNNKTYRVDDVDFNLTPNDQFDTKEGKISYIQYYIKRYNINIRDANQPLLISKSKERDIRAGKTEFIVLIPELCRATGLSDSMRNNFHLMSALSTHTRLGPGQRIERLKQFNTRLKTCKMSMETFQDWNLTFDKDLINIRGRILKPEMLFFGNQRRIPIKENADWKQEFRNNSMFTSIDCTRWYLICPNRSMREAQDFLRCLSDAAKGMQMRINEPRIMNIDDDRTSTYLRAIENCCTKDPQLIMCVVPNNNSERYSSIKRKMYVDRGVASQIICHRTIMKKGGNTRSLMSVATKVAIQINCKLGGAAWMIDLPLSGLMTIGFDVAHNARDKSKAYGALVATMDLKTDAKYFSAVSVHRNGEELSNELTLNVTKALKEYRQLHGTLPSRILLYRDGVGEGQTHHVVEHEVEVLKEKLGSIYKTANLSEPKFAFIVVSKRINTRFFNRDVNPPPGTVIDDIVTLPERYDFYLISQSVNQGTVSPTSYNIIHDTMGLTPDQMQILTYKMTHLYYNWSGTTRVPAVCQYAHKLAFLTGQSLQQNPSHLMERKLYFL